MPASVLASILVQPHALVPAQAQATVLASLLVQALVLVPAHGQASVTQNSERYDKAKVETVTRPGGYSVTSRSPQSCKRHNHGHRKSGLGQQVEAHVGGGGSGASVRRRR